MNNTKSTRVNNNNNSKDSEMAAGRLLLGYSVSELVDRLSKIYSCTPSRTLERKVITALKRGVDYGILVKSRNRYRYDPEKSLKNTLRGTGLRKRTRPSRNKTQQRHRKVITPATKSNEPSRPKVPRPTVPPPPNFQPPPKNLTREPFSKVIKHSSCCLHL